MQFMIFSPVIRVEVSLWVLHESQVVSKLLSCFKNAEQKFQHSTVQNDDPY